MTTTFLDAGSDLLAYRSALERAVYFDLSDYGKVELTGPDAVIFLHNLCTNDIKNLKPGGGCEAFLCNAKARCVAYVLVSRFGPAPWFGPEGADTLLLDMVPGLADKVLAHLNKYLISERADLLNRTLDLSLLRLTGPLAGDFAEQLIGTKLGELPLLRHLELNGPVTGPCHIRRQNLLGLAGFDLFLRPENADRARMMLAEMGVPAASSAVHDVLRIEAGTPEYGKDLDDERFVMEVGRTAQAICFTKGCYLGQESIVMARDRGHVNRFLAGIRVDSKEPLSHGVKVLQGEAEVGVVTSSAWSPRLEQIIVLAYVRRGSQEPGTLVTVDGRKGAVAALPVV